ncbi:flagellar brake protein [Sedimenticola hydrogenitrophicus]|uniref:flagellar brake protein n=1 Tax=Sedimenticola hydrogenitrophicus TaxID=2967975 RepID=UPI0023AEBFB5|nr:flagellar brake protein [Sedimenticola hydrogenitrophicus]
MPENILNLHVGKMLQLQRISPEYNDRYTVMLIGSLPGQGVIVTTPKVQDKVQFIKEGARFAVRLLHGSKVLGFVSTVTHSATRPYPHLHMSYPSEIESLAIRNAERVGTNLPAVVRNTRHPDNDDAWQPVLVKDLSMTGARLESIEPLGRTSERLVMKLDIDVCGENEQIRVLAEICNRSVVSHKGDPEDNRYCCGISFLQVNRLQEVLLNNCVLQLKNGAQ